MRSIDSLIVKITIFLSIAHSPNHLTSVHHLWFIFLILLRSILTFGGEKAMFYSETGCSTLNLKSS